MASATDLAALDSSLAARDKALEQGYAPRGAPDLRTGCEVSGVAGPVDLVVIADQAA